MAKNINFVTLAGLVVDKKDYLCNTLAIKFMKKFISFFGGATCWWNSCFNRDIRVCS